MPNEINYNASISGLTTFYAVLEVGLNLIAASGGAVLARDNTHWAAGKIPLSDSAAAYHYNASVPTGTPPGVYTINIYQQLGGSPALSDTNVASGRIEWNGVAELSLASVGLLPLAGGSVNDTSPQKNKFVVTSSLLSLTTDTDWTDQGLLFTGSSVNAGKARHVIAFDVATKRVTVRTPFAATPANGDTFIIIGLLK